MNLHEVIVSAVNTEKSVRNQEKNQQTFVVHPDATKIDIKNALAEYWNVTVKNVQIIKLPTKYRVAGRKGPQVKRLPKKKAVVTLKEGEKFELLKFAGAKKTEKKKDEVKKAVKKEVKPKKDSKKLKVKS